MNKSSTIQLVFVIIGIISFWEGLQNLFSDFVFLLSLYFEDRSRDYVSTSIFTLLLSSAGYLTIGYFFIANSLQWSKWCAEKSNLDSDFKIVSSVHNILYVLFIIIGSYALMKNIPFFLDKLYLSFTGKVSVSTSSTSPSRTSLMTSFLTVLVPTIVILSAKNCADYFAKKIDSTDNVEITENKDSSTDIL